MATVNLFAPILDPIYAAYPGLPEDAIGVGTPPKAGMGDIALRLFDAARALELPPPRLAQAIAAEVDFGAAVTEARPAGPYLNLWLDRARFARDIVGAVRQGGARYGGSGAGAGQRALIEHTSINPNASPHVGRARNAMIGDSLARLLRFHGYDTQVHYYVNDMGRQIGLLVLATADDRDRLTFDDVLARYVAANERAAEDEAFAQAGYDLLARMEAGEADTAQQFREVVDLCLEGQLGVLARIGAHYDQFDRESQYVRDPRLDQLVEQLRGKEAVFTDEDQRLVVDLRPLGHEPDEGRYFVLMRANGSSMYGYRDLAYNLDKNAAGADCNLVVMGEDHKLYQQQIAMILAAGGHAAPEPIYYAYIVLKDGKMSTRQGKVVLLSEFLDRAAALARERVAEQCASLPEDEQQAIADRVAVSAIRFTVLRVSPNKNVTFDMEASLSFTGDTGPYVQYSCARISSILRKYDTPLPAAPDDDFPLTSDAEWALLMKLALFPEVCATALAQRSVAGIAQYALETARLFTTFYHECPVLTAETPALVSARAQLCAATRQTLENALGLLGIDAPQQM